MNSDFKLVHTAFMWPWRGNCKWQRECVTPLGRSITVTNFTSVDGWQNCLISRGNVFYQSLVTIHVGFFTTNCVAGDAVVSLKSRERVFNSRDVTAGLWCCSLVLEKRNTSPPLIGICLVLSRCKRYRCVHSRSKTEANVRLVLTVLAR